MNQHEVQTVLGAEVMEPEGDAGTGVSRNDRRSVSRPSATSFPLSLLYRLLDEIDYGIMLVNVRREICYANRAARDLCRGDVGRGLACGRLATADPLFQDALDRALIAARHGRRTMVAAGPGQVPLAVLPLAGTASAECGEGEACALLLFGKAEVCHALSVEFFAREYGLTLAEGQVLKALRAHMRPAEVARCSGIAISTVRTHISNIRAKTGAASIGELVLRLAVLPPLSPVAAVRARSEPGGHGG